MTLDGALMGAVGQVDDVEQKVVGAIASHTWGEYVHASKEFNADNALQYLVVELEVRPWRFCVLSFSLVCSPCGAYRKERWA